MTPTVPQVVTPERLREAVAQRGEFVRPLPDGLIGSHAGYAYELRLVGVHVVTRTRWSRLLPHAARRAAAQLVNDWNRDRVLPTLHTEARPEGVGLVIVESMDVSAGLTNEQLTELLDVALLGTERAIAALTAAVPAPQPSEGGESETDDGDDLDDGAQPGAGGPV